jgi:hypothetical protein
LPFLSIPFAVLHSVDGKGEGSDIPLQPVPQEINQDSNQVSAPTSTAPSNSTVAHTQTTNDQPCNYVLFYFYSFMFSGVFVNISCVSVKTSAVSVKRFCVSVKLYCVSAKLQSGFCQIAIVFL